MTGSSFIDLAKRSVLAYTIGHTDPYVGAKLFMDDIWVVWYCKTLQNHKALLTTSLLDGMLYEFTYNGDKAEAYLDAYKKFENIKFEELIDDV